MNHCVFWVEDIILYSRPERKRLDACCWWPCGSSAQQSVRLLAFLTLPKLPSPKVCNITSNTPNMSKCLAYFKPTSPGPETDFFRQATKQQTYTWEIYGDLGGQAQTVRLSALKLGSEVQHWKWRSRHSTEWPRYMQRPLRAEWPLASAFEGREGDRNASNIYITIIHGICILSGIRYDFKQTNAAKVGSSEALIWIFEDSSLLTSCGSHSFPASLHFLG